MLCSGELTDISPMLASFARVKRYFGATLQQVLNHPSPSPKEFGPRLLAVKHLSWRDGQQLAILHEVSIGIQIGVLNRFDAAVLQGFDCWH